MIDVPLLLFLFHAALATTMRSAADLFESFSRTAAPAVVSALWQGAIVAAGLAVCMRLARRASAANRFAIWAAGFLALVCLPFFSNLMPGTETHASVVDGASAGPFLRLDPHWSLVIGAAWLAASLFRAVALGVHSLRLRRLWKNATPIESEKIVTSQVSESRPLGRLRAGSGAPSLLARIVQREAEICTTKELDRPAVIGFFAPRILIPEWLLERLSPEELKHVVLHEREHLRRGDDWINLLQKFCLVLFPLNPALMWMDKRLASEREMACDEGVVRATKAPRAYAACLASLAERGLKHRAELLSLGAWQRRPELVERVHRILRHKQGLSPIATRVLVGALSCGLVVASVELSHAPQLVAFAPAPQSLAQERAASAIGDARYVDAGYGVDARGTAGFRAMNAVAEMPATGTRANDRVNRISAVKRSSVTQAVTVRRNLANAPHVVLLKAEMPNANAMQREEVQTAWIVFTAWQQVKGSGAGHRGWNHETSMRQDYDSPTAEDGAASDGAAIGNAAVTQLIFRIDRATRIDQATASAGALQTPQQKDSAISDSAVSGSSTSNSSNANISGDQPAALILHDGWFVFQL